ncbi:MAG: NAD(P)-binding domain-containing protein [Leptospiraceae bacterium]|nr:NAD(P)-binding domain-containing protein [Leptospiraceae bacterium]MDW7977058.1 NAD(P)-binding domain-containing protein [Leptospiraceae bacterium]
MEGKIKVCIIGAGASGITVAKAMKDLDIPFDCFEKGSDIGGNWRFGNDNGMSNIYKSLHINTHRDRMQYADFPMPKSYPDFPGHELILKYFQDYVDHFDLRKHIIFRTGVEKVEPIVKEDFVVWKVTTDKNETRFYDAVVVANGHHWFERWPNPPIPGTENFKGVIFHSHKYVDPQNPVNLINKKVVILGMGNSAMDIACELSNKAISKKVILSSRRGAWIIPNYMFGFPTDKFPGLMPPFVPYKIQRSIFSLLYRIAIGDLRKYNLPKPDHKIGEAHPTISQDLLVRMGRGDILYKPMITKYEGKTVFFADGTYEEDVDAVIYCTGYDVKFPFFDDSLIQLLQIQGNDVPLYYRLFTPIFENLFFVGLIQPLGAIMPIAELQGKWIGKYLMNQYQLPQKEKMWKWIEDYRNYVKKRYVASPRHTMQVDFDVFLWHMKKEIKKGEKRAKINPKINVKALSYEFDQAVSKV